jgi:hypothetical protein
MRERAHLLGGALRIRSRPGAGCVIWAHAPLSTAHAPREAVSEAVSEMSEDVAQAGLRGARL